VPMDFLEHAAMSGFAQSRPGSGARNVLQR
jgi:hypothetical protein